MNGRAHAVLLFVILCLLPLSALADIESGLTWLTAQQRADGALAGPQEQVVPFQATAEAIDTLATLDALARIDAPAALGYLDADPYRDTEWLARRIIARAQLGEPVAELIDQLRTHRGRDGGFGGEAGHQSTLLSTAWALKAFAAAGQHSDPLTSQAVGWLLGKQQTSGRWPAGEDDTGLYLTTQATSALWHYRHTYALSDSLGRARQWLLDQRVAGHGWVTALEATNSLLAVLPGVTDTTEVTAELDQLKSSQTIQGSWGDGVHLSALTLRVLAASTQPTPNPDFGSVRGRVVNAISGQPIAGADVSLVGTSFASQSDSEGRFQFGPLVAGDYELSITTGASLPAVGTFSLGVGENRDLGDLGVSFSSTTPMVSVVGNARVVTESGATEPVEGARVSVAQYWTLSDSTGRFGLIRRFRAPSSGQITIRAELDGYRPIEAIADVVPGDTVIFNPAFEPLGTALGASLYVAVKEAGTGAPIANAVVSVSGATSDETTTDTQGRVEILDLNTGLTQITVTASGYGTAFAQIDVASGQIYRLPVDLTPLPNSIAGASGRVVDAETGDPIAGAVVELDNGSAEIADSNGEFSLNALEPDSYTLTVIAAGYSSVTGSFAVQTGDSVDLGDIPLSSAAGQQAATLAGGVRFRSGKQLYPAIGARIEVNGREAMTDVDGRYVISGIEPGSTSVSARYGAFPLLVQSVEFQPGGTVLFSPVFESDVIADGASIEVAVADAKTGASLVGARVQLGGANSHSSITGGSGTVPFESLNRGSTSITVTLSGYGSVSVPVDVVPGLTRHLPVNLSPIEVSNPGHLFVATPTNFGTGAKHYLIVYGAPGTVGEAKSSSGFYQAFEIDGSGVALIELPYNLYMRTNNRVEKTPVVVEADQPISMHWLNRRVHTSDMSTVFDVGTLGTDHYVSSAVRGSPFVVIAAPYDGTTVAVTPTVGLVGYNHAPGEPLSLTLNAGEAIRLVADGALDSDFTGTRVIGDKPIAVFSGNVCATVPLQSSACDFIFSQFPSVDRYTRRVVTGETAHTGEAGNLVRIIAALDGTAVSINGQQVAELDAGGFHEVESLRGGAVIEGSEPVMVVQFLKGQSTTQPFPSDPAMTYVPGVEHWLQDYVLSTPVGDDAYPDNFLNIVVPTAAIETIRVDGEPVAPELFAPIIGSDFSYANVPIDVGAHRAVAGAPFLVLMTGFADWDTYLSLAATRFSPGASVEPKPAAVVGIEADQAVYSSDTDASFVVAVNNYGERSASMAVRLRIDDAQGRPVIVFGRAELGTVEVDKQAIHVEQWRTDGTIAGEYTVAAELLDAQGNVIATDSTTFEILVGDGGTPTEDLSISTDKPQYTLGEPVTWSARIDNLAGNRILRRAQLALVVTDASAGTVAERLIDLPEIQPHGQHTLEEILATLSVPGTYTLHAELHIDGEPVTADSTTIEVVAASVLRTVLTGQITLGSAEAPVGEGIARSDSVHNIGETPLTDLRVARVLADDTSGKEIARSEATVTLAPGATTDWNDTLQTDGLTEGDYLALLLVREGETWLIIDHAELTLTAAEGGGPGDPDPEDPDPEDPEPEDPEPEDPEPEEPEPVAIPVLGGGALIGLLLALMLIAAYMHRRGRMHTSSTPPCHRPLTGTYRP